MGKRKKVLRNKSGSISTEKTQTVGLPKGYVNIPTIDPVRRMSVTTKEGINMEKKSRGGALKYHKTLGQALKAAKKRSKAGGRDRKK